MIIHCLNPINNPNGGIYQLFPISATSLPARWIRFFVDTPSSSPSFIGDATVDNNRGIAIFGQMELPLNDAVHGTYDLSEMFVALAPLATLRALYATD